MKHKVATLLFAMLMIVSCVSAQTRPHYLDLRGKPWVDVREFGAKGDGIATDTAAIQAAIDSLNPGGSALGSLDSISPGVVFFPPGKYVVGNITIKSMVSIVGASRDSVLLIPSATSGFVLAPDSSVNTTSRLANFEISNITIAPTRFATGLASSRATCGGINLRYSILPSVSDVAIYNIAGTGLYLEETYDGTFQNIDILFTGTTANPAVVLKEGTNDLTNACHFFKLHLEACPKMLFVSGGVSRLQPRQNQFIGCKFESTELSANTIEIGISASTIFSACSFITSPATATALITATATGTSDLEGLKFIGCDFVSSVPNTGWVFNLTNPVAASIIGCSFRGVEKAIKGVNTIISGNTFYDCGVPNIEVVSSDVSSNRLLAVRGTAEFAIRSSSGIVANNTIGGAAGLNAIYIDSGSLVIGNRFLPGNTYISIGGSYNEVRGNIFPSSGTPYNLIGPATADNNLLDAPYGTVASPITAATKHGLKSLGDYLQLYNGTTWITIGAQADATPNSTATTVASLTNDFNALLTRLRATKLIKE